MLPSEWYYLTDKIADMFIKVLVSFNLYFFFKLPQFDLNGITDDSSSLTISQHYALAMQLHADHCTAKHA